MIMVALITLGGAGELNRSVRLVVKAAVSEAVELVVPFSVRRHVFEGMVC